jgi:hypothetical protein
MIILLAWSLLRERLSAAIVFITLVAGMGVVLVSSALSSKQQMIVSWEAQAGNVLILCGVLCCTLYTVFSRKLAATIDLLFTVALQQSVGLIWALAILPLNGEFADLAVRPDVLRRGILADGAPLTRSQHSWRLLEPDPRVRNCHCLCLAGRAARSESVDWGRGNHRGDGHPPTQDCT